MQHYPVYSSYHDNSFQIAYVSKNIIDVIPRNTPILLHQLIYVTDDGHEIITDADDLLRTIDLFLTHIQQLENVIFFEIKFPGECIMRWRKNQLTLICKHTPTLDYWMEQILKEINCNVELITIKLKSNKGKSIFVLPNSDVNLAIN